MATSTNTAAANLPGNAQSNLEPLSPEYFHALSTFPAQEADLLLIAPDFSDATFASRVAPAQALDYLNAIVSLSPPALSSSAVSAASASESQAAASRTRTGSLSSDSVKLFLNIRNAAAILAASPTTRHQISTCGIIPKLNIPNNPYAHVEFLQCCILASQYRYAHRHFHTYGSKGSDNASASVPNFQINTEGSNTKSTELFLRYHYLRGIILYACNDIQSAISEWNHCLSAPSMVVSQIAVDAYKKMVLAKCLACQYDDEEEMVNGSSGSGSSSNSMKGGISVSVYKLVEYVAAMPKGTSNVVKRFFNVSSGGGITASSREREGEGVRDSLEKYHDLLNMFFKNDFQILNVLGGDDQDSGAGAGAGADVSAGADADAGIDLKPNVFQEDGNTGMIKQLVPIMRWRKLRSIAKIYSVIPLPKLSAKLKLGQQDCVQFLIQVALRQDTDGESKFRALIEFTVDDETDVIYFDEEGNGGELQLEGKIEKCMALAKRVKDLDVAMASSAKYQVNVLKSVGEKDAKGGGNNDSRSVIEIS